MSALFAAGALCHALGATRPFMIAATPWILLYWGSFVLFTAFKEQGAPIVAWAAAAAVVTFFLEALGVATGVVFGSYAYGDVLGVKVLSVPPLIGFNWVVVVLGLSRFLRIRFPLLNPAIGAFSVAAAAVAFDWVLEPFAISLEYWTWSSGVIPLKNYFAWFLIAYACALPTFFVPRKPSSFVPSFYVLAQTVFFAVTRFFLSFR